ncbi:MAG: DUF362 domain-containing protein [Candidatus Muirbacterium halophilum]|nr:DUF362 domain-containing protein [Candidatus Muirbacterium halophilum]MCK9476906.1 DUF362 domain-containing protein [Candidatus Muirbacterium halophilum]
MKVFFERVGDYNLIKLKEVILRVFKFNGFFDRFDKQSKILLKPNLLKAAIPEKVVTTHPAVFEAIISVLKDNGYNNICAGDSPGVGDPIDVAKKSGILDICNKYNIEFKQFLESRKVSVKDHLRVKNIWIWDKVQDFDIVINLPKLKTHCLMLMTLGVKNFYGLLPGKSNKANGHFQSRTHEDFSSLLIDIFNTVESIIPVFSIIDGIWGMEGEGPGSGDKIETKVIWASFDAFLMDFAVVQWLNIPLEKYPIYNVYSRVFSSRKEELDNMLKITGRFEKEFILPEIQDVSFSKIPLFVKKLYNRVCYTYPVILKDKCIKCMNCKNSCPPETIYIVDNYPEIKYNKCIKCFCCHEMCPVQAIIIKKSLILKIFDKAVYFVQKSFRI